jgi:GT2 family glycosyltransferase
VIITGCIVTYNNERKVLKKAVHSFLDANQNTFLYIIDNSQSDLIKDYFLSNDRIVYVHNPSNPGFGASHNIAINKSIKDGVKYHFIINPDVFFDKHVINSMIDYIKNNQDVGMMMPKILNLDGSLQNLPKLLPSPLGILLRKLKKPSKHYTKFINQYELREVPEDTVYNAPVLSGCFTLLNLKAIKEVGMYDDRFFMYFEDWDLSRRMHEKYKTVYFPKVSVYHGYESGANKRLRLFKIFIQSAVIYFDKWGWFFDKKRKQINNKALAQFK